MGSRPRWRRFDWVVTPVGQRSVWQRWAWMHPIDEHRLAADVDAVAAEREREQRLPGEPELAGADEHDAVGEARLGEHPVHAREADLERQRHVVGEHERPGAGAALAAVDGDEVDAALAAAP